MASPQLEDGFTRIANEIIEVLARINLSPYESRVLWFVLRKTYGWRKKSDWIAASQMRAGLGGLDRRNIFRALKGLSGKNMIVISRDDAHKPKYSFQKDYSKWRVSSKKTQDVVCIDTPRHLYRHTVSSVETHTKETKTKETETKEREISANAPFVLPDWIDFKVWEEFRAMRKKKRAAMTAYAEELVIAELQKLRTAGGDVVAILEQSIRNNWTDVYSLKDNSSNGNRQPTGVDKLRAETDRALKAGL
jgi:phage replication O-like protein O